MKRDAIANQNFDSSQNSQLNASDSETLLRGMLQQRILILDGAMGTMIQQY